MIAELVLPAVLMAHINMESSAYMCVPTPYSWTMLHKLVWLQLTAPQVSLQIIRRALVSVSVLVLILRLPSTDVLMFATAPNMEILSLIDVRPTVVTVSE